MTTTDNEAVPFMIHDGPQMVTVTEDGKQLPADAAGRALIYVGQRNRKLLGEALAFALLGEK